MPWLPRQHARSRRLRLAELQDASSESWHQRLGRFRSSLAFRGEADAADALAKDEFVVISRSSR